MVKYLKFALTNAIVSIFSKIIHAGRAEIDMKHIKWDLSLKAWVWASGVDFWVGLRQKLNFFSEYGHVAYQN